MTRKLTINIVGAGKLGKTIARLITKNRVAIINGVCNSTFESSISAIEFIKSGTPCARLEELPFADAFLITVPDDKISAVCRRLLSIGKFQKNTIVTHCSGSMTSDAILDVKRVGCLTASIHPIRSFAVPVISVENFQDTLCSLEGDQDACIVISEIFKKIGGIVFDVDKHKKTLYHASCCMASNYLITLADISIRCLMSSGIESERAIDITLSLMKGTLSNLIASRRPQQALTGPIKRGDSEIIKKHMLAIEDQLIKKIYSDLGYATINITDHPRAVRSRLKKMLTLIK